MVGQFKDNQVQYHSHAIPVYARSGSAGTSTAPNLQAGGNGYGLEWQDMVTSNDGTGPVTRGKRKGVKYVIKAL